LSASGTIRYRPLPKRSNRGVSPLLPEARQFLTDDQDTGLPASFSAAIVRKFLARVLNPRQLGFHAPALVLVGEAVGERRGGVARRGLRIPRLKVAARHLV
jgi:hypothetical protein